MTCFDVFNGDADGLCALHQLRLTSPTQSVLVSGPKRDNALLGRVHAQPGDEVTVLDVALAANREALMAMLERGVSVSYFDHHHAGNIPDHPRLCAHIDPSPTVCTAVLVDRHVHGAHRIWAIVAAFGDNLGGTAVELARPLGLRRARIEQLRELGETLNYNGYGDCQGDLIVHPIALYRTLSRHRDPFAFIGTEAVFAELAAHRRQDMEQAMALHPAVALGGATVHILPDAPWSRRVRGPLANELANRLPQLAHAVLTPNTAGGFTISLRTPKVGADAFCRQFPTGGGRAIAAGINALPPDRVSEFVRRLDEAFPG